MIIIEIYLFLSRSAPEEEYIYHVWWLGWNRKCVDKVSVIWKIIEIKRQCKVDVDESE